MSINQSKRLDEHTLRWVDSQLKTLETVKLLQKHDDVRRAGLKSAREIIADVAKLYNDCAP